MTGTSPTKYFLLAWHWLWNTVTVFIICTVLRYYCNIVVCCLRKSHLIVSVIPKEALIGLVLAKPYFWYDNVKDLTQTKGWWALVNVHEGSRIFLMLKWHTKNLTKIYENSLKFHKKFTKNPENSRCHFNIKNLHEFSWKSHQYFTKFHQL